MRDIVKEIEPKGSIMDTLIANGVISSERRDAIQLLPLRQDRARALVDMVLSSGNPQINVIFVKALETDYSWIVDLLRNQLA